MTARADAKRARAAVRLGVAAVLTAALAFAALMLDARSREVETIDGLVVPEWSEEFADARAVRIVSPDGVLTLTRSEGVWTLDERAGHPIAPAALTALHRSLTAMRFAGARTRDPGNYERLGVTDPEAGGAGTRLSLFDGAGEVLVDLIIGDARDRGFFVRRPGEAQAYAVDGDMPDVAAAAFWLDLDILPIAVEDIREVAITPGGGGLPYKLARESRTANDFALGEPAAGWTLITAGAANGPGSATAGLRFVDVASVDAAADGPPTAQHTVRTFDGLVVTLDVLGSGEERWARIEAGAEDGASAGAEAAAETLNAKTEGWIFKLPQYAPERLARQLDRIARVSNGE